MSQFFEKIQLELQSKLAISIIDVILTAALIYLVIIFLQKNNAARLIKYIVVITLIGVVLSSEALGFHMLGKVFSFTAFFVMVIVVIVFPQEVRRGLWKISSPKEMHTAFTTQYECSDEELRETIDSIVKAVLNMAKKDVGALIVIAPNVVPTHILESGVKLNSALSCQLLECIFNTKAPLHDGAVFIRGNKILAAGCFLPLTQSNAVDKELGTRHRAAIGVSENYNLLAIIVSEETGVISVAHNGDLTRYYDSAMLTDILEQTFGLKAATLGDKSKRLRRK